MGEPSVHLCRKREGGTWVAQSVGRQTRLRLWSRGSQVRASHWALCGQLRAWSLFGVCVSLSLSLPLSCMCALSLSVKNKWINLEKKKRRLPRRPSISSPVLVFISFRSTYCSRKLVTIQSTGFPPRFYTSVIGSTGDKAMNETDQVLPSRHLCTHGRQDNRQIRHHGNPCQEVVHALKNDITEGKEG